MVAVAHAEAVVVWEACRSGHLLLLHHLLVLLLNPLLFFVAGLALVLGVFLGQGWPSEARPAPELSGLAAALVVDRYACPLLCALVGPMHAHSCAAFSLLLSALRYEEVEGPGRDRTL